MKLLSSYKFKIILPTVLLIAIICCSITYVAIFNMRRMALHTFIEGGKPVLENAQSYMDAQKFVALSKMGGDYDPFAGDFDDELSEYYIQTWEAWNQVKRSSNCKYLYSMIPVSGNDFMYVIDGSTTPDDVENFSPFGTVENLESYGRYPLECISRGESVSSDIREQEDWGWMVTLYSPILLNGKAVGFIACDFPAADLKAQMSRATTLLAFISTAGIIVGLALLLVLMLRFFGKIGNVVDSMNDVSAGEGDLTKRIHVDGDNELGALAVSCNSVIQKLYDVVASLKKSKDSLVHSGEALGGSVQLASGSIEQISSETGNVKSNIEKQIESVSQTSSAVNQILSNISTLNKMIENQGSSVSQASAAVEEMVRNIDTVNVSVDKMVDSFSLLKNGASTVVQKQNVVNVKIDAVQNESNSLQEANNVISSIAEQTNLLAMNAAIEAAHAGDAGKGFSVVADEIRKLSETSSEQSKTIGNQLSEIAQTIKEIVEASGEAGHAISDVSSQIAGTDSVVQEIKFAMQEQSEGSRQISDSLSLMNNSTSEVRSSSAEMAEGSKAILSEIKKLDDSASSMRDSMEQLDAGTQRIGKAGEELDAISRTMRDSISDMEKQVDSFKI